MGKGFATFAEKEGEEGVGGGGRAKREMYIRGKLFVLVLGGKEDFVSSYRLVWGRAVLSLSFYIYIRRCFCSEERREKLPR